MEYCLCRHLNTEVVGEINRKASYFLIDDIPSDQKRKKDSNDIHSKVKKITISIKNHIKEFFTVSHDNFVFCFELNID